MGGSGAEEPHIHLIFSERGNPDVVQSGVAAIERRLAGQTYIVSLVAVEYSNRRTCSLNRDMPELEARGFAGFVLLLAGDELRDGPSLLGSFVVLLLLSGLVPAPAFSCGEILD